MVQRDPRLIGGVYRLGPAITSGGILTTYTASNRNTSEMVGLQVINLPPGLDAQTAQRFLEPLEVRKMLKSPNVIQVYDYGIDQERIYIATSAPRGLTLRHVLDTENIDLQRTLELTRQMAQGVQELHQRGVTGIDLRPQLITVETEDITDRVQLDDVGLRLLLKQLGYISSQRIDDIGYLDPRYAPPELINGNTIGPWSDVHQLGLLLFELFTGRLPFVGRNHAETGILQSTSPVPRMTQYKHDTPPMLQELVDRALAKNPQDRFATVGMFFAALAMIQPASRQSSPDWQQVVVPTITPGIEQMAQRPSIGLTGEMPEVIVATAHSEGIADSELLDEEGVYAYLCYISEGKEIRRFAIKEKNVVIGRTDPKRGLTPDIDLSAVDPGMTVSRQHARLRLEGDFFYIEDLKSHNKTYLGELRLTPMVVQMVQHGDMLRLGAVHLRFRIPGTPDPPVFKDRPT